ncbi:hypothetical protein JOB18_010971 [Solea senegalensis]|uniref:Uncharacterized protein n=1 Tax=Solea senegalensis TaxID=28829 RepID=A0AAV6QAB4_SOLSE|nr:hypothetical protein JOB18_010971 [Solea senegalensis]
MERCCWKEKVGQREREFLWFPVDSELCNQHAKLLMSKATARTQTVYIYSTLKHMCREKTCVRTQRRTRRHPDTRAVHERSGKGARPKRTNCETLIYVIYIMQRTRVA